MMLMLSRAQMDSFAASAADSFVARMVTHIRRHFINFSALRDDEALRAVVSRGIRSAAGYSITAERDVARYINVSVSLGLDFAEDPRLPWALEILADRTLPPTTRTLRLHARAVEHLRQRDGNHNDW